MKNLFFFVALFMSALGGFAQNPEFHWEVNGVPVRGATSVTFVCTADSASKAPAVRYEQVATAGLMLHKYKNTHIAGNLLEAGGCALALGNLIEMNRTINPKSNYTTMFCISGGMAFVGYVLNEWVAPGFITRAGLSLQGNGVSLALDGR